MIRTRDILGYARVSTVDQVLSGQKDRLLQHGAVRVFEDVISSKTFNRPGLAALLDQARPNDHEPGGFSRLPRTCGFCLITRSPEQRFIPIQ